MTATAGLVQKKKRLTFRLTSNIMPQREKVSAEYCVVVKKEALQLKKMLGEKKHKCEETPHGAAYRD